MNEVSPPMEGTPLISPPQRSTHSIILSLMRAEQYLTPKFQLTFMIWGLFIQLKSPKITMLT